MSERPLHVSIASNLPADMVHRAEQNVLRRARYWKRVKRWERELFDELAAKANPPRPLCIDGHAYRSRYVRNHRRRKR